MPDETLKSLVLATLGLDSEAAIALLDHLQETGDDRLDSYVFRCKEWRDEYRAAKTSHNSYKHLLIDRWKDDMMKLFWEDLFGDFIEKAVEGARESGCCPEEFRWEKK